jgi:hypothetical protein
VASHQADVLVILDINDNTFLRLLDIFFLLLGFLIVHSFWFFRGDVARPSLLL